MSTYRRDPVRAPKLSGTALKAMVAAIESPLGAPVIDQILRDSGFERFRLSRGAGPCPPDADCDGFVEILAPQLLRVEEFGDVTDAVTEVQLSAEDFAAAALVFSDPALWALLDDPSLDCNPPTDVFEGMVVEFDGVAHESTTTNCSQPAIAAARTMAEALHSSYLP